MMNKKRWAALALALNAGMCQAIEFAGQTLDVEVGLQGRYYFQSAAYGQEDQSAALRLQANYIKTWNDGYDQIEFIPWYILDSEDEERRHGDIQDLAWIHAEDTWEIRTGIRKVFWGVTESQHLVDIINQTDMSINPDGEEKLGQPMINLSLVQDWGIVDIFLLAGHRERRFPGKGGRFRPPFEILQDQAEYESGGGKQRIDGAVRWQISWGDLELALSHFSGTSRVPELRLNQEEDTLTPYYPVIDQTGLEAQYILGDWILKLEVISNSGNPQRFTAATGGFEYTQVGIFDTAMDLGWIVEYSADDRGSDGPSTSEHDVMVGARLSLNDSDSSEVIGGMNYDTETEEKMIFLEAGKRITDTLKLNIDALFISHTDNPPQVDQFESSLDTDSETPPERFKKFATIGRDDYLQVELVYYF